MNERQTGTTKFLDEERALACVHCGLCLTACPTYLENGNENDSPRGRIHLMRALQDERITLGPEVVQHLDRCLGCRACETACPSGVQYGRLFEETRTFVESRHRRSLFQRWLRRVAIERVFPYLDRFRWALLPARLARGLGLTSLLPRFAREAVSLVPTHYEPHCTPAFVAADTPPKRGRLGLIRGCVMSVLFGQTNDATVRLLNRLGYDVVIPAGQGCCGALDAHGGNVERARGWARQNLKSFAEAGAGTVVTTNPGCILQIQAGLKKAGARNVRVRHIAEFLLDAWEGAGSD